MGSNDGGVLGTTRIVDNGPDSSRYNLVILGDGYTQAQLGQYARDAQSFVDTLFSTPPFDSLRAAFNVHRIDVWSTDSGADDPAACGGSGAVARTYLDASFCNQGLQRLLVVNDFSVLSVAHVQVPAWHTLLVIVNSSVYGGSGGQVACFSLAAGANEIALHEIGHSAFGLADEYEYLVGCGQDVGHDRYTSSEPARPNVTANTDLPTIKWRELVTPSPAFPSTHNADCADCDRQPNPFPATHVGAFEGAFYFHCGVYRSQFDCRMRHLGVPFCAVCQRRIRQTLAPFLKTAEIVQPFSNDGRLGMIVYNWTGSRFTKRWGTDDIGQGDRALAWLVADVDRDGRAEILQPWSNDGRLGLIVYRWTGSRMAVLWGTEDMGVGGFALAWLAGDIDRDGRAEILQPWSNDGGGLGLIVHRWTGDRMAVLWGTEDMGVGGFALAWLAADVDRDGQAELVQPWSNDGRLGMIVHRWTGDRMAVLWSTEDMGVGGFALAWLAGDIDGDGRTEILQPWSNDGRLGLIVHQWTGDRMAVLWGTEDIGEGDGALAWLVADVDGDGHAELVQPWFNDGRLGMIVYKWTGDRMAVLWGTEDTGQGSFALAWLAGDVDGDGATEIVQLWSNGDLLGIVVHKWIGGRMVAPFVTGDAHRSTDALSWLIGDVA